MSTEAQSKGGVSQMINELKERAEQGATAVQNIIKGKEEQPSVPQEFAAKNAPTPANAVSVMAQRFLQNFEYVQLDSLMDLDVSGHDAHAAQHPHIQFRLCGEDAKAMTNHERIAYVSRQTDRGVALLNALGLDVTDIHLDEDKGALLYDVSPREPFPEGVALKDGLQQIVDSLQEACDKAREARKTALAV